ncbi:MAG: glycerate kinase family protein [Solirubrobacterales bacterium]
MAFRYLVAPDSFKGTFSADEVAAALGRGIEAAGAEADLCPVADGGEGTAAILVAQLGGSWRSAPVSGPLGDPVEARFGLLGDHGRTAVLDVAAASGLGLADPERRDAEAASTRGTGELINAAIAAGARRVLVGAGGSATTDGGAGAIEAIGAAGGIGAALVVLCDTTTAFEDAAPVFAPQKGADPDAVERLGRRLEAFAATLPRDPRGVPMSGAAGGLSGGLWAAFGVELRSGSAFVLEALGFEQRLAACGAAITGEGRLDAQSAGGKIVGAVVQRSRAAGLPVHVVAGENALDLESAADLGATSVQETTTLAAVEAAAVGIERARQDSNL